MNERKLRIFVLADAGSFHTERYVAQLMKQGCEVFLASLESGNIKFHQLKKRGFVKSLWYSLALKEVRSLINEFNPDILNPHFISGYGYMTSLVRRKAHTPIVAHAWGSDILVVPKKSIFHKKKTVSALQASDVVFADSHYLLDEINRLFQVKSSAVIPWGIERDYLQYHKQDYSIHHPLKIIIPRPHEKGYDNQFVLQSLAPLVRSGEVILTFPAFGSQVEEFRKVSSDLVGDKLKLYERAPRSEFLQFMAGHDVYLSSAISDSSPVSLLEAMALGLIPVGPDIPGVTEWLNPDTGFVYERGNATQLHELIHNIVKSKNNFDSMRKQNYELIEKKAVFEENVSKMIGIMGNLVKGQLR